MSKNTCEHSTWIQVSEGRAQLKLIYDDRLQTLNSRLRDPGAQYPSIALFLGNRTKDEVLPNVFPHTRHPHEDRLFRLRSENTSRQSRHPLYLADVDPSLPSCGQEFGKSHCHPHHDVTVGWAVPDDTRILDLILARLIYPFTDVICIFADDCGGYLGVRALLTTWARLGDSSHEPCAVRPRVLVITQDVENLAPDGDGIDNLRHDVDDLTESERPYASLQVVRLPRKVATATSKYLRVKSTLTSTIDRSRSDKMKWSLLFTARHQAALFKQALSHFARTIGEPFDFVQAARYGMEVAPDLVQHAERSLRLAREAGVADKDVISVTASSILMDAYPPSMHVFEPNTLFKSLYRSSYLCAFSRVTESITAAETLCDDLQLRFCHFHQALNVDQCASASSIHGSNLRDHINTWSALRSNLLCLCCDRAKPEQPLPCGHSICDGCLEIYGDNVSAETGLNDSWRLLECPICGLRIAVVIRTKGKTAGVRMLTCDGGGVKGIVSLENLTLLQQLVGSDCPIQELFDLAYGASVGGLVILDLFTQDRTVDSSTSIFKAFARQLFGSSAAREATMASNLMRVFKTCLQDGMYSSEKLQEALVSQFGPRLRMFDYRPSSTSGTKFGVVACSTKDSSARVFTNYNGKRNRSIDSGYRLERPGNPDNEPFVWQVARATSAAPGLFRPIKIPSVGVYEDALKHNNPVNIALSECRYLWPSITRPDLVLSLGTGYLKPMPSPVITSPKVSFKDLFPFRVLRHFMSSIDGQAVHRDLMNRLDDDTRRDYFRLTIELHEEPTPDDFGSIESLSRAVRLQSNGAEERSRVVVALLISCFYLELDQMPAFDGSLYYCQGRIRCRSSGAVKSLSKLVPSAIQYFHGSRNLSHSVTLEDLCGKCGRYCRPIHFFAHSLEESVNICLRWGAGQDDYRYLSGTRQPISWFVHMQHLDAPFGHSREVESRRSGCSVCSPCPTQGPSKRQRSVSPNVRRLRQRK